MFIEQFEGQIILPHDPSESPAPLDGLVGVTFGVKNNISVHGHAMRAGSPALPDVPAGASSSVVDRLEQAGALCVGSLNMHELALGTTSNNAYFGPVRNPHDPTRTAGGSSGGSAAAVAEGSVAFALGTDTGGSCRIPAAYCGVTGYRPTTGRYPSDGVFLISPTRDTVGVFAHHVSGIALVDTALTGEADVPAVVPEKLRIGLPRMGFFSDSTPEVATVVEYALERLSATGVEFVDVHIPGSRDIAMAGLEVVAYEAPREILRYLGATPHSDAFTAEHTDLLLEFVAHIASPDVKAILGHFVTSPISEETYQRALQQREELRETYERVFDEHMIDALVYPTVGIVAPEWDVETVVVNGLERPHFPYSIANTDPGSFIGLPSLSIPIPRGPGALPVGLGIEGKAGDDRHVLALAELFQNILTSPSNRI